MNKWDFSGQNDKHHGNPDLRIEAGGQIDRMQEFIEGLRRTGKFTGYLYDNQSKSVLQLIGYHLFMSIHPQGDCSKCACHCADRCVYSTESCEALVELFTPDFWVDGEGHVLRWEP